MTKCYLERRKKFTWCKQTEVGHRTKCIRGIDGNLWGKRKWKIRIYPVAKQCLYFEGRSRDIA